MIVPCIWLDDQAEPAAAFYVRTFPGGRITGTSRYPGSIDNPGGKPRGSLLKDCFGLSWQVVPAAITRWMTSGDTPARDRAFEAMLRMKKLDIAALQRAFEGRYRTEVRPAGRAS